MKKIINTASLLTIAIVLALDLGVAFFFKFAIKQFFKGQTSGTAVVFAVMMAFALFVAVKVTIDQIKTGVEFYDDKCVFNSLDSDNTFFYSEIVQVDTEKDEKISLIKNFLDRSGLLKIKTSEGRIHIINLGTLSKRRLQKIKLMIEQYMPQTSEKTE